VSDLHVLSLLLQYPTEKTMAARAELLDAARSEGDGGSAVARVLSEWDAVPLEDLQRRYVEIFDFDPRASLHLTYHVHGDRRQRGAELLRLKRRFAEAGLEMDGAELPDYLPVLLEFAALTPASAGLALLGELRAPLELVRSRLHELGSPYGLLLDAVVADLPRLTRAERERIEALADEGPPTELVGLDHVTAGPGAELSR